MLVMTDFWLKTHGVPLIALLHSSAYVTRGCFGLNIGTSDPFRTTTTIFADWVTFACSVWQAVSADCAKHLNSRKTLYMLPFEWSRRYSSLEEYLPLLAGK